MTRELLQKLKETAQAVLPFSAIVLILHFTIVPMPLWTLMLFLTGTILLIIGMHIFTMGADLAMMPIGEAIGSELTKSRNLWLIIVGSFIIGLAITIAEPDLQVLTKQVPAVPDMVLVGSVAFGVSIFLVLALLRILFQIPLSYMLITSYVLVFLIASFTAPDYLALGFDAGGVTTGPITVPLILGLGGGISAVRGGKRAEEDSFGLCALCSIGPVLAVLIMGMFFDPSASGHAFETPESITSLSAMLSLYGRGFLQFFREVLTVLLPIVIIFALFQLVRLKLSRTQLIRILMGIVYILIGLTIFLTGVNIGFMPAGIYIGKSLASLSYRWVLIPLSAIIGFFVVYAEPAVHLLNKQVEDITSGAISKRMMMAGLSIGVSVALILSVIRVLSGVSIWFFLAPGYAVGLILTFCTPRIFTAIAFDSGGVAAGTMTAAFLLPFAVGICEAVGGNIMTDAFGVVAMVAMMPLITIQVIGFIYHRKLVRNKKLEDALEMAAAELALPYTEPLAPYADATDAGALLSGPQESAAPNASALPDASADAPLALDGYPYAAGGQDTGSLNDIEQPDAIHAVTADLDHTACSANDWAEADGLGPALAKEGAAREGPAAPDTGTQEQRMEQTHPPDERPAQSDNGDYTTVKPEPAETENQTQVDHHPEHGPSGRKGE